MSGFRRCGTAGDVGWEAGEVVKLTSLLTSLPPVDEPVFREQL